MSQHDHAEYVKGCYRCELSADEVRAEKAWGEATDQSPPWDEHLTRLMLIREALASTRMDRDQTIDLGPQEEVWECTGCAYCPHGEEEPQDSCQCVDDCGCGEEPVPGLTVCACCLADCPHVHPTHNH